jgi:hypothetical protein
MCEIVIGLSNRYCVKILPLINIYYAFFNFLISPVPLHSVNDLIGFSPALCSKQNKLQSAFVWREISVWIAGLLRFKIREYETGLITSLSRFRVDVSMDSSKMAARSVFLSEICTLDKVARW